MGGVIGRVNAKAFLIASGQFGGTDVLGQEDGTPLVISLSMLAMCPSRVDDGRSVRVLRPGNILTLSV